MLQIFALLLRCRDQGDNGRQKSLRKIVPGKTPLFFPDEVVGLPCTILDMSKLFGQGGGVHGLLRLAGNCAGGSHDSNLDLKLLWKRYYMARGMIFNYLGVEGDDCLNFFFAYF